MNDQDLQDRRRHQRREVVATAMGFVQNRLYGTFLVQDLSAGGACLVGHVAAEPGELVTLLLQFPGRTAFAVSAKILRHTGRSGSHLRTAVHFQGLSAEEEDTIQDAIMVALERERARQAATVLVLHHDGVQRDALEQDLIALGHETVGVATPLEALAWLERPGARIATVFVALEPGPAQGLDVLAYLTEHHPLIRRVVVTSDGKRGEIALEDGRAHGAVPRPWDADCLSFALTGAVRR